MTATSFYYIAYALTACEPSDFHADDKVPDEKTFHAWCGSEINPIGSYFWAEEGEIISNIMS